MKNKEKRRSFTLLVVGKNSTEAGQWWCMPLIPALGRQRQVDLCEFKARPVYRVSQDRLQSYRETLSQQQQQTH